MTRVPEAAVETWAHAVAWLRSARLGLLVMALLVGLGAGAGAVVFRYLIFAFTWLFTGSADFGVQGHVPSPHFPGLGIWFIVLTPILGGLIFGPIIHFFAREARGHGVPEVMIAVAENGGRIRPQVTIVKAFASALCIGSGGSVGREGPIVQIGSALASTFGQLVRMSEGRLRILVACGAAGGISATFNAPLAGVFFGLELILREVSLEAFVAVLVASMTADTVGQAAFGSHPFFSGLPMAGFPSPLDDALCAGLGLLGGLVGVGFKAALYHVEDLCDRLWREKPEWLRPAVGGLPLGLLLLAVPQMYGVGYPVMDRVITGGYVFWFLLVLIVAKVLAASLTIGVGGSGGVFAPSLFVGATLGTAYGLLLHQLLGAAAGPIAAYGMVGMGAVFAGAARAPLTSTSSVLEMTGDFGIVLPVMLATALAAALSARLSYGTIYTTKLLRRGTDIERPKPSTLLQVLTAADAMVPLPGRLAQPGPLHHLVAQLAPEAAAGHRGEATERTTAPHFVFANEPLQQALRQLVLYGHQGLPVLAENGEAVVGWLTNRDVMRAFARRLGTSIKEIEEGAQAAQFAEDEPAISIHESPAPLLDYRLVAVSVPEGVRRLRIADIGWPEGSLVVAIGRDGKSFTPSGKTELRAGDRLSVLTPVDRAAAVTEALAHLPSPAGDEDQAGDQAVDARREGHPEAPAPARSGTDTLPGPQATADAGAGLQETGLPGGRPVPVRSSGGDRAPAVEGSGDEHPAGNGSSDAEVP